MNSPTLLIINAGSSSVKFQLFSFSKSLDLLAHGKVFNLGTKPSFKVVNELVDQQKPETELATDYNQEQAIALILDSIHQQKNHWEIKAVAHRVVHGGPIFTKSLITTPDILRQLKTLSPLAPLHQPHNLAAIEIIARSQPNVPQIACFDTAFHAHHDPLFTTVALPSNLREQGIRRYGFHGLSYEWIAHTLKQEEPLLAKGRVVAAHLGNGASLCAIKDGQSIDTSMGLTALDGLPMGTRCGSIDPGAILYMGRELGLSITEIEHILYNQSGLLGLSEFTNDVKELTASDDPKAQFALDYFCLKTAQYIAAMAIALSGIDALVFTGGIGENSSRVRDSILSNISCLRPFSVLIIPANEEKMMAMHALDLLE